MATVKEESEESSPVTTEEPKDLGQVVETQANGIDLQNGKKSVKAEREEPVEKKSKRDPQSESSSKKSASSSATSIPFMSSSSQAQNLPNFAATYLQNMAAFAPYSSLFSTDPTQSNPFLSTTNPFGINLTDAVKSQETLLKSLAQAATGNSGEASSSKKQQNSTNASEFQSGSKLSGAEIASLRQLIAGYRESAALLSKTAEELEAMINRK